MDSNPAGRRAVLGTVVVAEAALAEIAGAEAVDHGMEDREATVGIENREGAGTTDSAGPAIHLGAPTAGTVTGVETVKSQMTGFKNAGLEGRSI
jgi:hypothetical protein